MPWHVAGISRSWVRGFATAVVSSLAAGYAYTSYTRSVTSFDHNAMKKSFCCLHEQRFRDFASFSYGGVLYMTPNDFLKSLVQLDSASLDHSVVALSEAEVRGYICDTPAHRKAFCRLFRNLKCAGLISFTEYVFLIQILTKPTSGLEIAFKMLDFNMNGSVDALEFVKLNHVIAEVVHNAASETDGIPSDLIVPESNRFRTTLVAHLFGKNARGSLSLDDFTRFVQNVQRESLEAEFYHQSLGNEVISCVGFARILLRHTRISSSAYEKYIKRLRERLPDPPVITFEDFRKFFGFVNSLDDFILAVRMYTIAGRPLAMTDFARAAKACTGHELPENVLRTVYALFDLDNDGCLSHQEFLQIMKDRRSRGLYGTRESDGLWDSMRHCISAKLHEPTA